MPYTETNRLLGAFLALFLFLTVAAPAQTFEGPEVKEVDIEFVGPETISIDRIRANLKTKVGTPYSERFIEEDIRGLYGTGDVANVQIITEPVGDGVRVRVLITGRPAIEEILVEGADQINERRVRRELAISVGDSLNEFLIEESRQNILKLYRDKYFTEVTVDTIVRDLPQNRVGVLFRISEGPKLVVRRITFEGNASIPEKELRKALQTKTSNILSFFTKDGRLLPTQLAEDEQAVRTFYQNRGFADVQILDVRTVPMGDRGVELIFTINEGIQYRVNSIKIEGSAAFPAEDIRAQLQMVEGELYTPEGMGNDLQAIRDFYGRVGYVDMITLPEVNPAGEGLVDITYRIDEGIQSYVNLVNVQGNARTQDRVIRRELALRPGDVFDTTLLDISRSRLQGLNYFERVETVPQDTIIPGRKDLNVIVEEKRTGSFNFGVGFSTIDSLVGFAEVQQTNFDLLNWPRFTGGGQRFRARAQYGIRRRDFLISLTEPWFLGYRLSFGGELFYRDANFLSAVYDQANYGAALQMRRAITPWLSAEAEYKLEGIRIFNVDEDDVGEFIQSQAGTYTRSALSGGLELNTRDDIFLTRSGWQVELGGIVAGLGGDVRNYNISFEASRWISLPFDMILLLKAELATVDNYGGDEEVPIFDRLYLGGANNMRGFQFRDVGPKDEFGNPIGGQSLYYVTADLTFPIIDRIRGAVFLDVGQVNADAWDFSFDNYNADFGFGLWLNLPIGPIRMDYGIPIQADQFNDSSGQFNINVGYQF